MTAEGILERLVELVEEDFELHQAIVAYIESKTEHEHALADLARRRSK